MFAVFAASSVYCAGIPPKLTLMNPWCSAAKNQGRYYLVGLVEELFDQAHQIWSHPARSEREIL